MKKLIAMFGVAVLLTGCSGSFNIDTNPDEENFDENYQGSSELDLENAGLTEEPVEEVVEETTEDTGTGEIAIEETGTGEVVTDPETTEDTGTGETVEDLPEADAAVETETAGTEG